MTGWQYATVTVTEHPNGEAVERSTLDDMGAAGWELVSVVYSASGSTSKDPRPEENV